MSKKAFILTLIALLVVALLVLTNFGRNLPFSFTRLPVYTEEIPETRPVRLDQALLERFEGENMADILAVLAAEKAAKMPQDSHSPGSSLDPLYAALPDSSFPFSDEAEPRDGEELTEFVTTMKRDGNSKPSAEEIWRFTLALYALKISPDQLPSSLRMEVPIEPESDTLASRFYPRESAFVPPFTIGNFDSTPDLEVFDQGGTRLSKISEANAPVPVEGHGILFAGSELLPADFDDDGDMDLFVVRPDGFPNSLYRNDGSGHFEDVTIELGLLTFNDTSAAAWIDYDSDGKLDLLEGSIDHPLNLFHQTAGGSFQPVAWDLKLWVHRDVRSLQCTDVSGDGIADIFIGIDEQPDRLLVTTPGATWDAWRFHDSFASQEIAVSEDSEISFIDFNHDGALDLALFGKKDSGEPFFRIVQNDGDGIFSDVTEDLGFSGEEEVSSLETIDFDRDGYGDLFIGTPTLSQNRLFWNRAGRNFRETTIASRAGFLDEPKEILSADLDRNGASDLLYRTVNGTIRWIEAQGGTSAHLTVELPAPHPGGKVVVTVRDQDWILQTLTYTLGEQSSLVIGLGEADIVEHLAFLSPDGKETLFETTKIAPNGSIPVEMAAREPDS